MNTAYFFRIGPLHFIINAQSSKIGFTYPRVFVRFPDNSYLNIDLSLPAMFIMSEDDWMSWLDGTQQEVDTIEEIRAIAKENGFDWDKFEEMIFELYKSDWLIVNYKTKKEAIAGHKKYCKIIPWEPEDINIAAI